MRKEWEVKNFEDCLQKVGKINKIPKKEFLSSGLFPIVSQEASFINGYWNNEEDVFKIKNPVVIFGDHTKIIKYVDFDFVSGADGVKVLSPIEEINSKFFSYHLQSIKLRDLGYARHYRLLKEKLISYPNIDEQKEIAAILDNTFESIDKAKTNIEKNIENAKELFQSKLNHIFSQTGEDWRKVSIESLCSKTKNINWKENTNNEFDYIDLSSVSRISLEVTDTKKIKMKNAPSRAKKIVEENDVIFGTTRPTLKRATKINKKHDGQICSTGFVVLRPINPNDSDWIFYYLLSSKFMKRMESLQRGASYPAVSDDDVKKSMLTIPSIDSVKIEQIETLDILDNHIQSLLLSYEEELENLEELKKSILQKAFSGELTNKNKAA
jgi:type I restriction enzyme, S subunit